MPDSGKHRMGVCRLLAWTVFGVVVLGRPAAADVRWSVQESSAQFLRLRVEFSGARLEPLEGRDPTEPAYSVLRLPGTVSGGEPGLPMLPTVGRWVVLPPTGAVALETRIVSREPLGSARLLPHPTPTLDPRAEEPMPSERLEEAETYSSYRHAENAVVHLGEPVYMRRQRMVSLRVEPVMYTAATGRVDVATIIEIELRFEAGDEVGREGGRPDSALLGSVLNPEQAALWRCLSPEQERRMQRWRSGPGPSPRRERSGPARLGPFDPVQLLSDEYRLRIDTSGLWRVSMGDLISQHGFPTDVRRDQIRLYQKRSPGPEAPSYPAQIVAEVPLHFLGNPSADDLIQATDEIVFYGFSAQDDWTEREIDGEPWPLAMPTRPDSFNSANVYVLAAANPGTGGWARMETETFLPSEGSPRPFFRRVETFTGDAGYQENPVNTFVERFHWNEPDDTDVRRTISAWNVVPGSSATVTWSAVSFVLSSTTPRVIDFYLRRGDEPKDILLSQEMASRIYERLTDFQVDVEAERLGNGFLSFGMQRLDSGSGSQRSVGVFLGRVELAYDALYRADDFDVGVFSADTPGVPVDLEIEGFGRSELVAYELTDPRRPRAIGLSPENLEPVGAEFTVSLHVEQGASEQRSFIVQPSFRIQKLRSDEIERDSIPDLFASVSNVQVLALGPEFLREKFEPWVDWRRQHHGGYGWNVEYIDVQQVYDQFSGGLQSPYAIREFAEYAYVMWDARALILVGDANEDTRGVSRAPGPNLVPPSLHLQTFATNRELLVSDKWYGLFGDYPIYPRQLDKGPDLMVGRLPVADAAQTQMVVDKIRAYEQPRAEDMWRGRTLWMADDAYSTDYLGGIGDVCYNFRQIETEFVNSQRRAAATVAQSLDAAVDTLVWNIDAVSEPCRAGITCENLAQVRACTQNSLGSRLVDLLSEGWLMVGYQGHANFNVLAHESVFQRATIASLRNSGRPFLFFGMGCHVTDFVQYREGLLLSPIGEHLLMVGDAGAVATYGSSGFEFLTPNAAFMELITSTFFAGGRTIGPVLGGEPLRTQWMLGETLAQAELDILATSVLKRDEMMAQYNLLGDPLLRLDAAPPRLSARAGESEIGEGAELVPPVGERSIGLGLDLVDETGIARLDIVDSEDRDYGPLLQLGDDADPRARTATIDLPIHAQGYTVDFELYDGAYPETRPTTMSFKIPFELEVRIEGKVVEEGTGSFAVGATVAVEVEFTSPISLTESEIELSMDGALVRSLAKRQLDSDGRQWEISYTAEGVESEAPQAIRLLLAGDETVFTLTEQAEVVLRIEQHYPFPNPTPGEVSFVVRATRGIQWARLSVYDLQGRQIVDLQPAYRGSADFSFEWNGRDRQGDELANGVYFYRIEISDGNVTTRSDMGRVVMMR